MDKVDRFFFPHFWVTYVSSSAEIINIEKDLIDMRSGCCKIVLQDEVNCGQTNEKLPGHWEKAGTCA